METEDHSAWPDAAQLEANCRHIISTLTLSTDHGVAAFAADWLTSQGPPHDPHAQDQEADDGDDPSPASMWCLARVLYDFPSADATDFEPLPENLSVQAGDLVAVQYTGRRGWWYGRVIMDKENKVKPHGRAGWFPSAYAVPTELDRGKTDALPLGLVNAIESFTEEVTGMTHDTGDSSSGRLLSFQKGEIISVWEEGNGGWLLGSVVMNEQGTLEPVNPRGWFPASVTVHFPPDHLLLQSMVESVAPHDDYEQIVDNLPLHASMRSGNSSPPPRFGRTVSALSAQSAPSRAGSAEKSPVSAVVVEEGLNDFSDRDTYVIDAYEDQTVHQLSRIYDALIDTIHSQLDQAKTDIEILQHEDLEGAGIAAMDVMALRRAAGRKHAFWISIRWWKLSDFISSATRHRLRTMFREASPNSQADTMEHSNKKNTAPVHVLQRRLPEHVGPIYVTLNYADSSSPPALGPRNLAPPVSAWASRKLKAICEAVGISSHRIHLVDCVPGVRVTIQVDEARPGEAARAGRSHPHLSPLDVVERIRDYSIANPTASGIHRVSVLPDRDQHKGRRAAEAPELPPSIMLDPVGLYSTGEDDGEGAEREPQQARWWSSPQRCRGGLVPVREVSPELSAEGLSEPEVRILVRVVKAVRLPLRDAMGGMLDCPYVSLTVEEAPGESGMTVCTPNARRVREVHNLLLEGQAAEAAGEVDSAAWDAEFMLGVPQWRAARARVVVEVCNWNHTGADALVGEVVDPRLTVRRILEAEELDGWFVLLAPGHQGPILSPPPARSPCLLHMRFVRAPDSVPASRAPSRSPPASKSASASPAEMVPARDSRLSDAQTQTQTRARSEASPDPAPARSSGFAATPVDELKLSVREWVLYPSIRAGADGSGERGRGASREDSFASERGVRFSGGPAEVESEFHGQVMGSVIERAAERVAELKSQKMEARGREREAVVETLREQRRRELGTREEHAPRQRRPVPTRELPTRESFLQVLGQARDQIHRILQRSGQRDESHSASASPPSLNRSLSPVLDRSEPRPSKDSENGLASSLSVHAKAAEVMYVVEDSGAMGERLLDTPVSGVGYVDTHGIRGGYEWVGDTEVEDSWLHRDSVASSVLGNGFSDGKTPAGTPWRRQETEAPHLLRAPETHAAAPAPSTPAAPAAASPAKPPQWEYPWGAAPRVKVLRMRRDAPRPVVRPHSILPSGSWQGWSESPQPPPPPPPPFSPPPVLSRPDVRRRAWDIWVPGQDGDVIGAPRGDAGARTKLAGHLSSQAGLHPGESAPLPLPDADAEPKRGAPQKERQPSRALQFGNEEPTAPRQPRKAEEDDAHSKAIMRGLC